MEQTCYLDCLLIIRIKQVFMIRVMQEECYPIHSLIVLIFRTPRKKHIFLKEVENL